MQSYDAVHGHLQLVLLLLWNSPVRRMPAQCLLASDCILLPGSDIPVWLCLAVSRTLLSRFPEALVVPDLCKDVRFKDSAVVNGWPHLRFYAAAPLVNATNSRLGTL